MTTSVHPAGPSQSIRPIECAPWCSDGDGHVTAVSRDDQSCWGASYYVELSLEEVSVEFGSQYGGDPSDKRIWPSIIGPNAYRRYDGLPCVYLHFTLQEHGRDRLLDDSCKLTAEEARRLAASLIAVADEIEGTDPI